MYGKISLFQLNENDTYYCCWPSMSEHHREMTYITLSSVRLRFSGGMCRVCLAFQWLILIERCPSEWVNYIQLKLFTGVMLGSLFYGSVI